MSNKEQKTIKASTLPVDTKVICNQKGHSAKFKRHFARIKNGKIETFEWGYTSWSVDKLEYVTSWDCVTLEDGTIVLPE